MHKGDEHRKVVVVAQKLRQPARLAGARPEVVGPGAGQQRHLPPMRLCPLAPIVKRFVRLLVVCLAERTARFAVGTFKAGADNVEPAAVDVQLGEALLGVGKTALGFLQAGRRALAVGRRDTLAQAADEALAARSRQILRAC